MIIIGMILLAVILVVVWLSATVFAPETPEEAAGVTNNLNMEMVVESDSPIVNFEGELTESLGIETLDGVFSSLIERGAKVPISISETFSTARDHQANIILKIYRGDGLVISSCQFLGKFKIVDIPPMLHGEAQVQVRFKINAQKEILISAFELNRGIPLQIIRIDPEVEAEAEIISSSE